VRKGIVDLTVVALVMGALAVTLSLAAFYFVSSQMAHVQGQVAELSKTLQGLAKEVMTIKAQVQELMKYSPIYSG